MKTSSKILAGLLAAGIALPALAQAQQAAPPPPPGAGASQAQAAPHGPGGPGRMMRDHRRDRPSMLWDVSSRLAAAEIALGITPEQNEAWTAFTRAAIAFAQPARPNGPGAAADDADPDAGQPGLADDDADTDADTDAAIGADAAPQLPESRPFARVDRMLERSIQRGQAAETLRTAMTGLAAVLTPEQTATAERLLRELPRPGRHGKGPHHHGQNDRGPDRGPEGGPSRGDRR